MNSDSGCDFSGNPFSQWTTTSATTSLDVPFAEFWNTIGGSANIGTWWQLIPSSPEYFWLFSKETSIDLPAYEKSIHGKPRGKLKAPKPQCPRGFKHLTLRHEFSGPHFR